MNDIDRGYQVARMATLMLIATVGLTVYAAKATWQLWHDLAGEAQQRTVDAVYEAFQ